MSFSQEQVLGALKRVKHPGKGQDVVSLNMISNIKINGNEISFDLIFERSNDPVINSVRKACVKAVKAVLGKSAKIEGNIRVMAKEMVEKEAVLPGVKNIIAIASGKGGVGKSTIAANLAVSFSLKGFNTGLIDADIFGPSIPKMLNVEGQSPSVIEKNGTDIMVPVESFGIKLLSIGFFIKPNDPVVWRGPLATNALRQFINQSEWGELDYMFIDLPPGTSDIHLTIVQELALTGAVIVSTPQKVALADAIKGINMFRSDHIGVPVLGLVENMAWFTPAELPDNKYYIFGKDGCSELARELKVPLLGQIPIVQSICEDGDAGKPSVLDQGSVVGKAFMSLADRVVIEVDKRNKELPPTRKVEITK
ncbi:MAG: Mrp/NBP35 family ATP-binding protein [Bacteroidales bacterium]|nr:Mrp/NBP35 family ATP-binding protein [Bacteroidales bacterium]